MTYDFDFESPFDGNSWDPSDPWAEANGGNGDETFIIHFNESTFARLSGGEGYDTLVQGHNFYVAELNLAFTDMYTEYGVQDLYGQDYHLYNDTPGDTSLYELISEVSDIEHFVFKSFDYNALRNGNQAITHYSDSGEILYQIDMFDLEASAAGPHGNFTYEFSENGHLILTMSDADGKDYTFTFEHFTQDRVDREGLKVVYAGDDGGTLSTSNASELVYGGEGDDRIYLRKGWDVAYGGEGNDHIYGGKGLNTIYGGSGNDYLHTGSHSSKLYGGTGDDTLVAQNTKNSLHHLTGGEGNDTFVFTSANPAKYSRAIIYDFDASEDTLVIGGQTIDLENLGAGMSAENVDGDLVLHYGDNDMITFENYFV